MIQNLISDCFIPPLGGRSAAEPPLPNPVMPDLRTAQFLNSSTRNENSETKKPRKLSGWRRPRNSNTLNFVNFAAFCGPHSAYSANLIMHTLLPNPLKRALGLGLMLAGCLTASARAEGTATDAGQEITLAAPFGDHAVLQQKTPLPVWGTALPGAKVTLAFPAANCSTTRTACPSRLSPPTAIETGSRRRNHGRH